MATITEWLMKQEKANAPMKDGVPCLTRHMFSSSFVLFLPVLLTDIEHWYCVVVNLVDKRIEVLDSMELRSAILGKESRFDVPGVTSCLEHHHLQLQSDSASLVSVSVPKL
ncbi:hypothetical protein RHMOL_Rhmol02G0109100 [Rhododendron molle]|uniref:Uncharacterized protein n=1 Tax=Rhododendron molle TaxID=49168 RepID=A0ACC0PQ76_RHOML|nr:hypothetical protein RHMOL_Rhmol02G0109100 [Rhododendron molle]